MIYAPQHELSLSGASNTVDGSKCHQREHLLPGKSEDGSFQVCVHIICCNFTEILLVLSLTYYATRRLP